MSSTSTAATGTRNGVARFLKCRNNRSDVLSQLAKVPVPLSVENTRIWNGSGEPMPVKPLLTIQAASQAGGATNWNTA